MHEYARLDALLQGRHSYRGFLPHPVPRELIERLLRAAGRSASWCNAQPWHAHVVGTPPTGFGRRVRREETVTWVDEPVHTQL